MKATEGKNPVKGWKPSEAQAKVLGEAIKGGYGQSVRRVAMRAGVPCRTVYNWLGTGTPGEDPGFKHAWDNLWPEAFKMHMPGIMAALVKKARAGDVSAIRLIAEMGGKYTPKQDITNHHDIGQTIRDSFKPKEQTEQAVEPPARGDLKPSEDSTKSQLDPPTPGEDGRT